MHPDAMRRVVIKRRAAIAIALALALPVLAGCDYPPIGGVKVTKPTQKDTFNGEVQAVFLTPPTPTDEFRDMRLLANFSYLDPYGVLWEVPAGYVTNGASIPWYLWPALGGPYDGPYRDAAVLHDYYCEKQLKTWEKTHEMFYNASRRRGVSENKAKSMYLGLQMFGPQWAPPKAASVGGKDLRQASFVPRVSFVVPPVRDATGKGFVVVQAKPPVTNNPSTQEKQIFDELKVWIERDKPSLAEIQKKVQELRAKGNLSAPPVPPKK